MLTNFLGVLPILTPPLCALAFIRCSKSNREGAFQNRVSWTICQSWLQTVVPLIYASRVVWITGVNHWLPANLKLLIQDLYVQFANVPYSKIGFSESMGSINFQTKENAIVYLQNQERSGLCHVSWGAWQSNSFQWMNSQVPLLAFRGKRWWLSWGKVEHEGILTGDSRCYMQR
jgi:hypothetical protein